MQHEGPTRAHAGASTRSSAGARRLAGRTAVITGTSRGLGRALAAVFEEAGARVFGASRSNGVDVTDSRTVAALFDRATAVAGVDSPTGSAVAGRIDILINNAGILTPRARLIDVDADDWRRSIEVNLTGVFLCMREALQRMLPQGSGLIINVSSGVAHRAAPEWGPYAAAKWGVEGLTRLAAEEVRESGIRIVSVDPTATRTGMRAAAYPEEDPASVKTPEETARFFVALAAGEIPFETGAALRYEPPGASQRSSG